MHALTCNFHGGDTENPVFPTGVQSQPSRHTMLPLESEEETHSMTRSDQGLSWCLWALTWVLSLEGTCQEKAEPTLNDKN